MVEFKVHPRVNSLTYKKKKTDYHDTKNVEVQWISSREHGLTLKFHKMEGIFV